MFDIKKSMNDFVGATSNAAVSMIV